MYSSVAVLAALVGVGIATRSTNSTPPVPSQAQVIHQTSFAVLDKVAPPSTVNGSTLFFPPGLDDAALLAKPFHIYDDEFYDIIGANPTLTLAAMGSDDPFHEAPVWFKATDEMFFVQNAGSKAAGTGIQKSSIIQKISLAEVGAYSAQRNATGKVTVTVVNSNPTVVNPNGGTNYKGQIVFTAEGQGDNVPPALYVMNPYPPYNTTVLLNNFFGRQFNSLNDVVVHPVNKDLYITDPTYGYVQDFRPPPGMQKQVWRFNDKTAAVTNVADGFNMPNGIAFSPSGSHAYIADTGIIQGFFGTNFSFPASIYRYDVQPDGTFENRKVFAYVTPGVPDGVHIDTKGNVYAGCGDGVHVWNPSGKFLGKIYIGKTAANFQFAGKGRMVIMGETELYYATLAAEGSYVTEYL
ncbi:calcium-dependent phosphotriesterase [Thozetella sp. PMI_491]|nr:calcium-dependent phosphotriesterase [Thozetella sp. PMI_491]